MHNSYTVQSTIICESKGTQSYFTTYRGLNG